MANRSKIFDKVATKEQHRAEERSLEGDAIVLGISYILDEWCCMLFLMIVEAQFAMVTVEGRPCSRDRDEDVDVRTRLR